MSLRDEIIRKFKKDEKKREDDESKVGEAMQGVEMAASTSSAPTLANMVDKFCVEAKKTRPCSKARPSDGRGCLRR